jgi:hypothetical protein
MVLALATLAALAVVAGSVAVSRRRRIAHQPAIRIAPPSRKAGVSHLAARVSELSDLGLHLHAAQHRRRLGTLLGSGHAATR